MPDSPVPVTPNFLSGNPIALASQVMNLQQMQAQRAVGNAFQGAIRPDGSFDPNAAALAIKNDPSAAYGAAQGVQSVLEARARNISNATNQLGLGLANNAGAATILAPYASLGRPLTDDEQYSVKAKLAAAGVDPATVAAADVNGAIKSGNAARLAQVQGMGPGAAASGVEVAGQEGQPLRVPLGSVVANTGVAPLSRGLSPIQAADQGEYLADQTKSAATMANVRPLQQALPLVSQLSNYNFGPGSADIDKVKGLLTTLGITGVDPTDQKVVREEVNKKLHGYASGAISAGRSDNALSQALTSNPSLDLTQPANLNLIKNQIAMDKMDAAIPAAAGSWNGYKNFKTGYYPGVDQRAFGFDNATPKERQAIIQNLGPPKPDQNGVPTNQAYLKFAKSYDLAKKAGMIQPSAGVPNGQ
jgi:hypothetical protein